MQVHPSAAMSRPASFLEPEEGATIAIQTKVQKCGILSKKPFGHQSSKWSKRFFILKDGFILWYAEKDAKEFAKTGIFNIHPKAAIPLGGCYVDEIDDKHNKHVLRIMHADFGGGVLCLAADSAESLQDWKKWITDCGRVTWKNAQIGDTMIACLKAKGDIFKEKKEDTEEKLKVSLVLHPLPPNRQAFPFQPKTLHSRAPGHPSTLLWCAGGGAGAGGGAVCARAHRGDGGAAQGGQGEDGGRCQAAAGNVGSEREVGVLPWTARRCRPPGAWMREVAQRGGSPAAFAPPPAAPHPRLTAGTTAKSSRRGRSWSSSS